MPDVATAPGLVNFTMPSLGADMDAGTVVDWFVAPGQRVHHGEIVAVVQTDKSDLDVEVFVDGIVAEIVVPVGIKVPVGTVLATLRPLDGADVPTAPAPAPTPAPAPAPTPPAATPAPARAPAHAPGAAPPAVSSPVVRHLAEHLHVDLDALHGSGRGGRITRDDVEHAGARRRVSPRARRLARERGIDLGTLPNGVITGADVLRGTATPAPAAPATPATPPREHAGADTMRLRIARVMTRAWQEIPHYHVATRIDCSSVIASLAEINAARPAAQRILPAAMLAQAVARAAADVPAVNGHWVEDDFVPGVGVHLGVVVALRTGGLLAPVIHDAADKDLTTIMAELRDLVTRARSGRLRASEVMGATITITELGEGGVESVTPIIHPPQVAIVGLGAILDQPWAEHGLLGVRPVVHATLAADHRAVDGRIGSLFLSRLAAHLQEPAS